MKTISKNLDVVFRAPKIRRTIFVSYRVVIGRSEDFGKIYILEKYNE